MNDNFLPQLFKIADKKAAQSQNNFIFINLSILILLTVSSILSIFVNQKVASFDLSKICILLMIVSTLLNLYILFFRPEKNWYEGRAIAESVKTLAWKFITGTKPFKLSLSDEKVEMFFNENLKKIIGQRKDFYILIGNEYPNQSMISDEMIDVRKSTFENRKTIYLQQRIQDQINWYAKNSKKNSLRKNITFAFIVGFQIIAIILFWYESGKPVQYSLTSASITITSVFLTWLQLKRYQELTDSYGITATELKFIKEKSKFVLNNEDLEKYVDDSESAISREHTLWLARRDNLELYK